MYTGYISYSSKIGKVYIMIHNIVGANGPSRIQYYYKSIVITDNIRGKATIKVLQSDT